MNGRSDASTSTDDVKARPLCLFYFSQPLGVLATEPPRAAPCPAHLTAAWAAPCPAHMAPAWTAPWPPAPAPSAPPAPARSSSLFSAFSGDAWPPSSASSRDVPRRYVPYHTLLPPLRLPAPAAPLSPDDPPAWPLRGLQPERFSLPPIELPRLSDPEPSPDDPPLGVARPAPPRCASGRLPRRTPPRRATPRRATPRHATPRRAPPGVHKLRRRARASALRRTLTNLMQRSVEGSLLPAAARDQSASSSRVRAALRTLRAAWPPPPPPPAAPCWRPAALAPAAMLPASAAPGLLRRRYSVPETIMRKYRLAQQSSESEELCAATPPSAASPAASCAGCAGHARADRELMRKSALLRRLWGRAPAPAPAARTSRSLHGSSSELRRSPAGSGWASPKRLRLDWPEPSPGDPPRDAAPSPGCSDCTYASHRAHSPASPASRGPSATRDVFARYTELASDAARLDAPRPATDTSESLSDSLPTAQEVRVATVAESYAVDVKADQYASLPFETLSNAESPPYEMLEIVVSETVEAARAAGAGSPRAAASPRGRHVNVNIDEYVSNILVESLNSLSEQLESMSAAVGGAGVVVEKEIKVRLQNAGVNTIVHLSPTSNHQIIFGNEELCHADDAGPPPPALGPTGPVGHTPPDVNRAVLQQIQKLFHDELYRLDPAVDYPGEPTLARLEVSNVDLFLDRCDSGPPSAPGGAGPGDRWTRRPAPPHSASMEAHASSSDAEPSACASLVDSLDDPASPRPAPPAARLARSAVAVLDLLPEAPSPPEPPSPPRDRPEAFFVPITDDDCDKENVVVADRLPDKIRERLFRRHRKREMRMECARRGRTRGAARERRVAERDARAVVADLVDELIAKLVRDEYKCMRIQQRSRAEPAPTRRAEPRAPRPAARPLDDHNGRGELRGLRGKLSLQPATEPRRIYQKSEIHDGDKCIEILEILEYVDPSRISPETSNSDERHGHSRSKKSRIPIPILERIQRTTRRRERERGRSPPPAPSPSPPPARRASLPPPAEPRPRAGSLQFRRVFDIIPEERADTPCAPEEGPARRASVPPLPPARATRSAATSPPPPQRASRSTMTSPRRAPPSPPAPRAAGSNGNLNERRVTSENSKQRRASVTAKASPACAPGAGPPQAAVDAPRARRSSSSGSDSADSSLLCAAPRWLAARRRRPRPPRLARSRSTSRPPESDRAGAGAAGGWSVTVAGSCRAALPADVEMRLRFPRAGRARAAPVPHSAPQDNDTTPRRSVATRSDERRVQRRRTPSPHYCPQTGTTECWCRCCGAAPALPPPPPPPPPHPPRARQHSQALPARKEEASAAGRASRRKPRTQLPELEAPRGPRRRRSGQMRRSCSLQCWLPAPPAPATAAPAAAAAARRRSGELAVEGSAIVPELKPRAPSMSERDLLRRAPGPASRAAPRPHSYLRA